MRSSILSLALLLIAGYLLYTQHNTIQALKQQTTQADTLIRYQNNTIARIGSIAKKLSDKNKQLSRIAKKLKVDIKQYMSINQQLKAKGSTKVQYDTVIVYSADSSAHTTHIDSSFRLLSDDSAIYVHAYIHNDSIHADTMLADVSLDAYIGYDSNNIPWVMIDSKNKNVFVTSKFFYMKPHTKTFSLYGGIFYNTAPGVMGTARYKNYYITVGYGMNKQYLIAIQKEVGL